MTVRTLMVVFVVGASCLAAVLLMPARAFTAERSIPGDTIAAFDPSEVRTITVRDGERAVELTRSGEGWVFEELGGYPAFADRAERLLLELSSLTIREARTSDPEMHGRLGVDDSATRITLRNKDGGALADVIAGRVVSSRGLIGRLVRDAGEDRVYWVEESLPASANPGDWLDRSLLDIDPSRIQAIRISHPDGAALALSAADRERAGELPMIADSEPDANPDHPALLRLPTVLSRLSFEGVQSADSLAFPNESAVVTEFETADGLVLEFSTILVNEVVAAARVQVFAVEESAASEAAELSNRFGPWIYFIGIERVRDMRLRPFDIRDRRGLDEPMGP